MPDPFGPGQTTGPWLRRWRELEELGANIRRGGESPGGPWGASRSVGAGREALGPALDFFRREGKRRRGGSDGAVAIAVATDAAAELLVPYLLEWAKDDEGSGWRLFVWVSREDFVPYVRARAREENRRWGRGQALVPLVTSNFDELVMALAHAVAPAAETDV